MRDRLIEIIGQAKVEVNFCGNGGVVTRSEIQNIVDDELTDVLADHLLENGVIVPPCNVGDTVYVLDENSNIAEDEIYEVLVRFFSNIEVYAVNLIKHGHTTFSDFGKRVFFTREEAEAALKAR